MIARRLAAVLLVAGLAATSLVWLSCQGPSSRRRRARPEVGRRGIRPQPVALAVPLDDRRTGHAPRLHHRPRRRHPLPRRGDPCRFLYHSVPRLGRPGPVGLLRARHRPRHHRRKDRPVSLNRRRRLGLAGQGLGRRPQVASGSCRWTARSRPTARRCWRPSPRPTRRLGLRVGRSAAQGDAADLGQALSAFRPALLFLDTEVLAKFKPPAAMLQNVATLYLNGDCTDIGPDLLKGMPHLGVLFMQDAGAIQSMGVAGVKGLRALSLADGTMKDLAAVAPLAGLQELCINGDDVTDLSALARLTHLRILSLVRCPKAADLAPLKALPLTMLAPPPAVTQEQFDAALADHPGLEGLELVTLGQAKFSNVKDLSAVKNLRALKMLVVTDTSGMSPTTVDTLKQLKGLRMLVLPKEFYEAEKAQQLADIQKALPGTVITEGVGICLGSGWLLVLLPVIAAAAALAALAAQAARHRPRDVRTRTRPQAAFVGGRRRPQAPGGLCPARPQRRGVAGARPSAASSLPPPSWPHRSQGPTSPWPFLPWPRSPSAPPRTCRRALSWARPWRSSIAGTRAGLFCRRASPALPSWQRSSAGPRNSSSAATSRAAWRGWERSGP